VTKPREWLVSAGSLPAWLADRWIERFGAAAAIDRARSLLLPPPVALRLNPRRPEAEARASESGLRLHGLTVPGAYRGEGGDLVGLAAEGLLYVQDEGSQLVARLAAGKGRILDACAAPGGKATALADSRSDIVVTAAEPDARRRATLARLCARWGAPNLHVVGANALHPPFGRGTFDGVLLDAPCSGLGTLARHPDIRWRTQAADLPRHAALQGRLLRSLADLVRPGGLLVYATCSSEPEENEEIVGAFLKESADFALAPLPAWAAGFAEGPFARSGARDGDSFFAALLRRR
jgi:16S rRNA (cytosine967-C5)-methyltransferase